MEVVAVRFPGVDRCDMERIARWCRKRPKAALGAWPDAELCQMHPQGERALQETPPCGCAADLEAVYLTLLDHHVLEVVRSATPESFTDRVIRFHAHGARAAEPAEPDPETLWCLQSQSADAECWGAVWKQYRRANCTKSPDVMAVKRLRQRAVAIQQSGSKETQPSDANEPAESVRAATTKKVACNGCVDADFCRLGASDLIKRVALDLRTMALAFNMDAVIHGRNNHNRHLLIVHRVLATYEAEAHVKLQDTLASAIYHPPIVSSLCWEEFAVSVQPSPASTATAIERTVASQESQSVQSPGRKPCNMQMELQQPQMDESALCSQRRGAKSPPVTPPPEEPRAAVHPDADAGTTSVLNNEDQQKQDEPSKREMLEDGGDTRSSTTSAIPPANSGGTDHQAKDNSARLCPDVSVPVKSAQLQAALAGVAQVRPSSVDILAAAARANLARPLLATGGAATLQPAWARAPPRTAGGTADVLAEYQRTSVHRHRDHRWGVRKKERQERQAWLEQQSSKGMQQQHQRIAMLTPTPSAQTSHRSNASCKTNKPGSNGIPAFRQDRSRWGVLRTQSTLARQRDFVAGNQRMIERSLSTSAIS